MAVEPGTRGAGGNIFDRKPPKPNRSAQPRAGVAQPTYKGDYRGPGAHAAVPYGSPGYEPVDFGAPKHPKAPKPPTETDLIGQKLEKAVGADVLKRAANPRVAALHDVLGAATGIPYTVDALRRGDVAGTALGVVGFLPFGRGGRAAKALVEAGEAASDVARTHVPRTLRFNEKTQQLPKARSRITNMGERLVDRASAALQSAPHVADTRGLRLLTAGERVAKAAGREQRVERVRSAAAQAEHLNVLKKVKPGSAEDAANFWYAQLPGSHRNAAGLSLVRAKQAEELQRITSGEALDTLNRQEQAVKAKIAAAEEPADKLRLLREIEDIRVAKTDLPGQVDDITASLAQLDTLIERPPPVNLAAIRAAHELGADRQQILVDAGRLDPAKAEGRKGLLSRWVGLEPTGEEAYIGHRLARPENSRYPYVPSGGTGAVKSPQGMTANKLVLASSGRLRPSILVAGEDWQAAQVFQQANVARRDLGELGTPFTGHVPPGHSLVNPKGRTVPADWKNEDLAQFQDGYEDIDTIREQAKRILDGFIANDRAGFERLKQEALEQGVQWSELRVVPDRLVNRYYSQFRPLRSRGPAGKAYDTAIDAVATSIVFARIGYIPKNLAQNLIIAVPHQGPMLLVNAVRAGQAMADPELRALLQAEVGHTGATGALAREAKSQKVLGAIAGAVSKVADDPIRISAFLHEAAAEGVISRVNPLLTDTDRHALLRLLKDKTQRPLLNDIRSRTVDAMADFSRMTPDQARMARRFLIIPGWLMAGSRYPFHFAATHPVRSALLAYIAMGEPGAPDELHFNHPINEYFHGTGYRQGIDTPFGRLRTSSLNPVTTPWELGQAVVGSARGKTGPFDYDTQTVFDVAQPLAAAGVRMAQGDGVVRSLARLAPNYDLIRDLIHPAASRDYPGDATRLGRLRREVGVLPIAINDPPPKRRGGGNVFDNAGPSGGSGSNIFDK